MHEFTSTEDVAAHFDYTTAPDFMGWQHDYSGHGASSSHHISAQQASHDVEHAAYQASHDIEHETEQHQPLPIRRRIQPARTRRRPPCGTE